MNTKSFQLTKTAEQTTKRHQRMGVEPIHLAKNENPYGEYNRYATGCSDSLRERIAKIKDVDPDQIFIGQSSRNIIDTVIRARCLPHQDKILTFTPGSTLYEEVANINRVSTISAPLDDQFQIDRSVLENIWDDEALKIIFISNPNNPTGNLFAENDIHFILQNFRGLVFIDESFLDFSESKSYSNQLKNYDHLIISQSLSMAWGMAGAGLALSFMNPALVNVLDKICPQSQVGVLTQEYAAKRFDQLNCYAASVEEIIEERALLQNDLQSFVFFKKVYPSATNFLLAEVDDAQDLCARLAADHVHIKCLHHILPNHVRISVGSPYENYMLIESLRAIQLDI